VLKKLPILEDGVRDRGLSDVRSGSSEGSWGDDDGPIGWRRIIRRSVGSLNPRVGSLDLPQRFVGVHPPADTDFLHGVANTCSTGKTPPNLPLLNTTHTLGATVVKPLKMALVPPFIFFASSLANSSRPVPEVGFREPVLEPSRTF
jgi:hypothetical protein